MISPDNQQVNAVVPRSIARMIDARADALGVSRSKYAAQVFDWWIAAGAPAVSKFDEVTRASVIEFVMQEEREEARLAAMSPEEREAEKKQAEELAWAMQKVDEANRIAKMTGKAPEVDPRAVAVLQARKERQRKKR